MSRPRRKGVNKWFRVTNELVCSFALPDCPKCHGNGVYATTSASAELLEAAATLGKGVELDKYAMCSCGDAPMKAAYAGRIRRNSAGRLEVRESALESV